MYPTVDKQAGQIPVKKKGVARLVAAARYSWQGIGSAFSSEEAFRLEVYAFLIMAPLGLWLGVGALEKVLLIGSLILLMIIELFNTAIEAVVNRTGPEFHELSRNAKDMGSACVLLGIVLVIFTWLMILGSKLPAVLAG